MGLGVIKNIGSGEIRLVKYPEQGLYVRFVLSTLGHLSGFANIPRWSSAL